MRSWRRAVAHWWGSLVIVALVALCAGLAQIGTGHALLRDMGLYEVPPSYTELAFSSSGDLPSQVKSEHARIKVAFSIHNVSGTSRTYNWSITLVHSGKGLVKASGIVNVPARDWPR